MTMLDVRPADNDQAIRVTNARRETLADEWRAASPGNDVEIAQFYEDAENVGPELDAWHETADRLHLTDVVVHVARQMTARAVLDIGCGGGHDLKALRAAGIPITAGIEPNRCLREQLDHDGFTVFARAIDAPVADADLLLCFDVLEHIPDPERFLADIASRARVGATLMETCSTYDLTTPLHLPANRGWHPGRVMESHGWSVVDRNANLRVWQRMTATPTAHASVLLVSYRQVSVPTLDATLALAAKGWRIITKYGDALVSRARSQAASKWWAETGDDVFLMIDDDIQFDPRTVEAIVDNCRRGHDIICAAYPVRNGAHLACRTKAAGNLAFGPGLDPIEIEDAATGFMAVHRRVLDAMIPTLPLCHPEQTWSFWPLFAPYVATSPRHGLYEYLSEDWAFCERAKSLGFKVYLDPSLRIQHLVTTPIDVTTMAAIHAAVG